MENYAGLLQSESSPGRFSGTDRAKTNDYLYALSAARLIAVRLATMCRWCWSGSSIDFGRNLAI
ncbi:MAG: hypothetical protein ACO3O3_07070, partial [Ilumatobacteraceae bacterium]